MDLDGKWFVNRGTGQTVLFRGVNVGGGTKLPIGMPSHERNGFWVDYDRKVTFVGRPFPLNEADEHLDRLSQWGFNLLRFVVTWEAIEHQGPGIYDQDYLEYVVEVLKKCKNYKLKVFIDPHQDTWSRQCGGSGHPGWTHPLVGLDPSNFGPTAAAIVQNTYPTPESFPKMIWNTNYQRLAAATLFTLFFAGKHYAPLCIVNGVNIQTYLQSHYFNAIKQVAYRIHDNDLEDSVVIGYDSMNEPNQGYIDIPDITKLSEDDIAFKMGPMPTAYEGMRLASGIPTAVQNWVFAWNGPRKDGTIMLDPEGREAWLSEEALHEACVIFDWKRDPAWTSGCIWDIHGIWDRKSETVIQPEYFAKGQYHKYWIEFLQNYTEAIRSIHTDAIIFVQPPVIEAPPLIPRSLERLAYAPHWYDGLTLVKKKWCSYNVDVVNLNRGKYGTGPLRFLRALRVGEKAIRQCFVDQLQTIQSEGQANVGDYPCVIGEIGIPFDMEQTSKSSGLLGGIWGWLSSFFFEVHSDSSISTPNSDQNKAMDANMNAIESNLLNCAIWHYMPDNDSFWGDCWNGEDLSILQLEREDSSDTVVNENVWQSEYSCEDESNSRLMSRSRNTRSIISLHRPYPQRISGVPVSLKVVSPTFNERGSCTFRYKARPGEQKSHETELYLPSSYYPPLSEDKSGTDVWMSHGYFTKTVVKERHWILTWTVDTSNDSEAIYEIRIEGLKIQKKQKMY
ncbi:glycoside hydrolase superfamily [Phycomyces blakesleeanus]|uniref:Glycoside hydrolase superfamily n=1 Tax=Phycomyces blakesleeanus TaxID=4837 RepID=A0ABR3AXC5_PHYBL